MHHLTCNEISCERLCWKMTMQLLHRLGCCSPGLLATNHFVSGTNLRHFSIGTFGCDSPISRVSAPRLCSVVFLEGLHLFRKNGYNIMYFSVKFDQSILQVRGSTVSFYDPLLKHFKHRPLNEVKMPAVSSIIYRSWVRAICHSDIHAHLHAQPDSDSMNLRSTIKIDWEASLAYQS